MKQTNEQLLLSTVLNLVKTCADQQARIESLETALETLRDSPAPDWRQAALEAAEVLNADADDSDPSFAVQAIHLSIAPIQTALKALEA